MKNKSFVLLLLSMLMILSCEKPDRSKIKIVPRPNRYWVALGKFEIKPETRILTETDKEAVLEVSQYFAEKINTSSGIPLEISDINDIRGISNDIIISTLNADTAWGDEGYKLEVQANSVIIHAFKPAGLFYGVQSLLQLLPPEIESKELVPDMDLSIPTASIRDIPRFTWRGMHLDVGRHFFPKDFIKKYLDLMAMYKMNTFHWHLVEDQGWRIEILKYPRLTEISAWRNEPDGKVYGGYYSQDDIREIVAYAKSRHITVVPEIELPGHCMASLAAYPELSCTGGPFKVPSIWGVKEDVYCAGNEATFEFLENVLAEVMELFPGEYIHIGGDEVPKDRWKNCKKCQKRIREERLADEHELQSYFIKRIEEYLNAHGRKLIGWDEILEGGLAPDATVMSWRGMEGGIKAAQLNHDVVMTPTSHCYFDYYQADPAGEPQAIGGYTTLKKVYEFNPVPAELNEQEAKHILGAQGNVWTEYISTPEYAEYMAVPRMIALAEVCWSQADRNEWKSFISRMQNQWPRLDVLGVNYATGTFRVSMKPEFNDTNNVVMVKLESELFEPEIKYTTDGTEPTSNSAVYTIPIEIRATTTIKAGIFENGQLKRVPSEKTIRIHKAVGKDLQYKYSYSEKYPAGGKNGLADGLIGSIYHNDGFWQGFNGDDLEVVVDLGESNRISSISISFLQKMPTWIFLPEYVIFSVSLDGNEYTEVAEIINDIPIEKKEAVIKEFKKIFSGLDARYIKVKAKNIGKCPAWHSGAGNPAWIFADELIVN
ncbi:MAG: family 20 glycosylhydrolase [Bacteroidota bacterium]|nr:family 20 glycosylhydrolase [Bacteroidota bacterium]